MTIKELLIELIKIPSVSSDIEQLHKIVDFVENYFKDTNWIIERYEFNQKPSIVIKNFEWKHADIILNWHLDVVPPSEEGQFEPYEKDGKLYGRWAWDMKSWDAIMMKLMKDLLSQNFKDKKIALILTTDEEVGGFDGAAKIVDQVGYNWDFVLIPDGWNAKEIIYAEKGIIHLTVKFYWVSSHASRPWLGENAIDNLFKFYQILKNYIENPKKIYRQKDHWGGTVFLNIVNWGKAVNMLADEVEGKIDIRFTEEFNLKELVNFIKKAVIYNNGEVKNIIVWDRLYSDPSHPLVQKYLSIAKKTYPEVSLTKYHSACDGRFFSKDGNVVLLHRPNFANAHWKKEYVVIDDLEKIYKVFYDFVTTS